jgi:hypothetical protein
MSQDEMLDVRAIVHLLVEGDHATSVAKAFHR